MSETPSLGVRLNQYIQNLKLEILQISGDCRSLFAHRAKIMYLSKYIQELFKQFSVSSTDQRIASPSEEIHFRQLMYILCDIRALINNYITEQNFVHFVLNQPLDDVERLLSDLKKEFDEHFTSLLSNDLKNSIDIKFDNDEYEQCKFEDYRILIQRLTNFELETKALESKRLELIETINQRLSSCESPVSSIKTKKIYTENEIDEILKNFNKYLINRDDYITLGTKYYGSYSKVYTGISKKDGKFVAIKVLNGMYPSEAEFNHFKEYLSFFISIKHPSILSFVGFSYKPLPLLYVTEDMSGGSLSSRLHDHYNQLDPTKQTIIALGIARAMQYLHSLGYIHRDLSSSSILLDEDDHPFISDFKLMSQMKKGNMGIQQITSWTAPEMIIGSEYDQKIDVYSYGIILWEILTREVPFRGLSTFAIAHEVCESDSRPLIPQNCPPKLAKLIQACWDKNPAKRPSFNDIVYSFESGKIYFLGTSSGPVMSYSRLFKGITMEKTQKQKNDDTELINEEETSNETETGPKSPNIPIPRGRTGTKEKKEAPIIDDDNIMAQLKIEEAINKFNSFSFDQIVKVIPTDPIALMNLFTRDLTHPEICKILTMNAFPKSLTRTVEVCEYPDFINNLTSLFYTAISEKICDDDTFRQKHYLQILMRLFKKFGSTHVSHFVYVIDYLFGIETNLEFTFSLECFKSLSPFLISHDFETRKKITLFLSKVVNRNAYDKKYSLIPIITNLLENLKPEMFDDILAPTLKLCESLCSFTAPLEFMIKHDAANTIVPLCLVSNDKISSQAMHLINKILSNSKPSENFIHNYLSKFANFQFDSNSSQSIEPLIILTHLVKTPDFIRLFIDSNEAIATYSSYLESKDDIVLSFTLRLTFSLISLHKIPANFSILGKQLISCLSNKNKLISMMASACLTSIVPSITDNFELFFTDSLLNYFKTILDIKSASTDNLIDDEERKACICALKLAGAFSMTIEGATFLHENSIVNLIIRFLKYREYRFLALTVLTSQSSQIPSSPALIKSLSNVINQLKKIYKIKNEHETDDEDENEEEEDYDNDYSDSGTESDDPVNSEKMIENLKFKLLALNFILNVIVSPKAATVAAHSIIEILHIGNDEDLRVKQLIVKIILVIVSTYEARDLIDYRDVISLIIKTLIPFLNTENIAIDAYKIFEILTTLDFGHQFLSKYTNLFKEKLASMKTSMSERNPCVRLVARLNH